MGTLSALTNTRIGSILYKLSTWVLLFFRKKVFFTLAVYWTFSNTLKALLQVVTGGSTLAQAWQIFLQEAWSKFLGAAPQLLQGLKEIQQGQIVDGSLSLWTAIASIYMMIFLYRLIWSRGANREVHWQEKALVLTVWFLGSALVHGPELLINISTQLQQILDTVSTVMPTQNTESTEALTQSLNNSTS